MSNKQGMVVYGEVAFEQDAVAAMRGDIVRALVELITNADDAYAGGAGGITVRVLPSAELDVSSEMARKMPFAFQVQDRAQGLTAKGMEECFAVLGGENQAFQAGHQVRGLLGRGAKDVAGMGQVWFEAVRKGRYSRFVLGRDGRWELEKADVVPTEADLKRLGLRPGQSGLTATVLVDKRHKLPNRDQLRERLTTHTQLRRLVARREVMLDDSRKKGQRIVLDPVPERGKPLCDKDLELGGGFGTVRLRLRQLLEKDTGPLSDYSEHGILISGTVASYMNAFFGLDGRPESGWIAGELECPQIETLVRDYDMNKADEKNPQRLVARDRDGLVEQHPFFESLRDAVIKELLPILDKLAKSEVSGHHPGAKLAGALAVAEKALGSQLRQMLREIDEEDAAGAGAADGVVAPLAVIPPRLMLHTGEQRTLNVRVAGDSAVPFTAEVTADSPQDVLDVVAVSADFKPHARLDAMSSNFTVRSGSTLGEVRLKVMAGDLTAFADVSVIPASTESPSEVEELHFERETYRVAPKRARNLRLLAPVERSGSHVKLTLDSGPVLLPADMYTLFPSPDGRSSECRVRVEADSAHGTARIQATAPSGESCETSVKVEEHPPAQGLELEIDLRDQGHRTRRAVVEDHDGKIVVRVFGKHDGLRNLLGSYDESKQRFKGEDEQASRAVLAEVIGLELASFLVEREAVRRPELGWDPARVINRQRERANRLIVAAQKALEERQK